MSLYTLLGLMSGTSIDGLDIVQSTFELSENEDHTHRVLHSKTYPYPSELSELLKRSKKLSHKELLVLDKRLGKHFAKCVLSFLDEFKIDSSKIDAIASHGHTIFHQPQNGYTLQIGCGDTIAYHSKIKVINDFRQKDIIAGGQGAPLVPIGDKYLYKDKADAFLNIGGFCNISIPSDETIAFDICPGNLPLNEIAQSLGKEYDDEGSIGKSGMIDHEIIAEMNSLSFYGDFEPKSLGTEWLDDTFSPLVKKINKPEDQMRTVIEHIATQITKTTQHFAINSLYITGGGAYNTFLLDKIREKSPITLIIPEATEIEYKEAIIFAFLGALYLDGRTNVLSSVTGASHDLTGGVLHLP